MISIKNDIEEKKGEAMILFGLIKTQSEEKGTVVSVPILKSSHILLLYNMIESTFTTILERIHDELSKCSYGDLNYSLKKLWVGYYFKSFPEKHYEKHLEESIRGGLYFPAYSEYSKRINVFSGNLDSRAIDAILKSYGIGPTTTPDRALVHTVKNKRNKLAHGEEMFKEACRYITLTELESLQSSVFNLIDFIFFKVSSYISNQEYRAKS